MTNNTTLSIFVDESGNLPLAGTNSRFYIVSLVAHNQQESKVYYDCGQSVITNLIHESMTARHGDNWEFAQDVRPGRYRLFQVADLVSFVSLIEQKRQSGIGLTKSEEKFFGGARNFRRNVLKPILRKRI